MYGLADWLLNVIIAELIATIVEKRLGVTISNTLCWDAHIDQLNKNCKSYLLLLSRIKVFI